MTRHETPDGHPEESREPAEQAPGAAPDYEQPPQQPTAGGYPPPPGQPRTGQASISQPPTGQAPTGQAPTGQASIGQASIGQAPIGQPTPGPVPPGQPGTPPGQPSAPPAQPGYGQTQALPGLGQQPYSAPPGPGYPGAPAPSSSGGPWIPLLAGATAFFLLIALVMSGLFIAKAAEQSDTSKKLATSRSTVSDQQDELADLEKQRDAANEQLEGSKNKVGALTDEKAVISQCLTLMFQFIEAAATNNSGRATALANQLRVPCDRAQAIVG